MKPIATDTYNFERLMTDGYTYVDKTAVLYPLINKSIGSQFFLSRPRRFGKSLLVSTFKSIAVIPFYDFAKCLFCRNAK